MLRQALLISMFFICCATSAVAQEIKELKDLGEKGGSVEVAIPADKRFNKSEKICFQSDKMKQVGCGKIFKVAEASIFVRVTAATFAKMQDGCTAVLDDATRKTIGSDVVRKSDVKNVIRFTFSPILVSPTAYNNVTYGAPTLQDSTTPSNNQVWLVDKAGTTSLLSIMLEWGRFLGPKSGFSLGLRYRSNPQTTLLADYVVGVSTSYVTITQQFSGLGLIADYAFYKNDVTSPFNIFFAAGIEFENSNLLISGTSTDDSLGQSKNIASLDSKIVAASLRLRPGMDWNPSKWFGLHSGLTVMVPLVKFASSTKVAVDDPHSLDRATAAEDLTTVAGHKLARFGVGLDLGFSAKF